MEMDIGLSIIIGIGLSTACGFRIFVPFLVMSIASLTGYLTLSANFEWIGTYPALLVFATATFLEILAYYIPWVDNALDTISTPVAVIAGIIATASVVLDVSPLLKWTLAVVVGGGVAGIVKSKMALLRGASSATTGGTGNFLVSTGELLGSAVTSLLAILLPVLALVLVLIILFLILRKIGRAFITRDKGQSRPDLPGT